MCVCVLWCLGSSWCAWTSRRTRPWGRRPPWTEGENLVLSDRSPLGLTIRCCSVYLKSAMFSSKRLRMSSLLIGSPASYHHSYREKRWKTKLRCFLVDIYVRTTELSRSLLVSHSFVFAVCSLQGDIGFRGLPGLPGPPGEGLQGSPVLDNFHSLPDFTSMENKFSFRFVTQEKKKKKTTLYFLLTNNVSRTTSYCVESLL